MLNYESYRTCLLSFSMDRSNRSLNYHDNYLKNIFNLIAKKKNK